MNGKVTVKLLNYKDNKGIASITLMLKDGVLDPLFVFLLEDGTTRVKSIKRKEEDEDAKMNEGDVKVSKAL